MDTAQRLILLSPRNYLILSLSASSVAEDAIVGTVVGGILGKTPGSTVTLTDSASGKFAINGTNVEVAGALDYETATTHNITTREVISGRGPKDTVLTITVTDVAEGGAPTIDADTTFATTTGWTDTDGGGSADLAITGGALVATGGTGSTIEIVSANILNCTAPATTINIQYEITAADNPGALRVQMSIGSTLYTTSSSAVGVQTTALTVGADDTILRIRINGSAGTNWTMDNIAII